MPSTAANREGWLVKRGGIAANAALSVLLAVLGWMAVQWRELVWQKHGDAKIDWSEMGMDGLQQFSFDVPFVVRHSLPFHLTAPRDFGKVVLLYMDEESTKLLKQSTTGPWSRAKHAELLDKLTAEQARAVVFDVVFDQPGDECDDAAFAAALARNGHAYLGATIHTTGGIPLEKDYSKRHGRQGIFKEELSDISSPLYESAHDWGLLDFRPIDGDHGVRRLFVGKPRRGFPAIPAISWVVAHNLDATLPEDPPVESPPRWINYYGPAHQIESVSYYRALLPDSDLAPGYFKDRIVVVGAYRKLAASAERSLDEFSTPWSRFGARTYTPGAEIHATALLNLLQREWLERLSPAVEQWFVVLFGFALGALRWLRPWRAVGVAVVGGIAIFAGSCLLQWHALRWWNWSVPVLLQLPLALVLAVASRYYLEERRKRKLRAAFGYYLSPELAEEIAERNFPLTPGGEKVVATLVFTDLEGFTTLSEKLGDSAKLGEVLTDYFTRTTREILAEKGTVIKFIGDAVFAAWGAPLAQADHAERAVRAAWRLARASAMEVSVPGAGGSTARVSVRTRIGIHTGEALAGNLGSTQRFDYTLIGDAVNFAARLEGVNKYTGTTILLSDDTARLVRGKFLLRHIGAFKVKGKEQPVVIHELLGDDPAARPAWLGTFEAALAAWNSGDASAARRNFEAVKSARDGEDGPSALYLALLDKHGEQASWDREIQLAEK